MRYIVPIVGSYRLTQKFAQNLIEYKGIKGHTGYDLACSLGTPIVAPCNGRIAEMPRDKDGYGNHIWLLEDDGLNTKIAHVFGHLEGFSTPTTGQWVKQGEVIGFAGSTGYSTGSHLHWGARRLRILASSEHSKYQRNYNGEHYEILDYENGYMGHFDFGGDVADLLEDIPPVALRYGQPYSYARELAWSLKYSEASVRKQALAVGFGEREWKLMKNAFVYGYYPKEIVFDTSAYALWAYNTYPAYKEALANKKLSTLKAPQPAIITK